MKLHKKTVEARRPGKGAVLFIAVLLISSAVLRLGSGAGMAIAQASDQQAISNADNQEQTQANLASDRGLAQKPASRGELSALLDSLKAREERLEEREMQIQMRKKALEIADREMERRIVSLKQIENDLRQTLSLSDGAAEGDLTQLTAVYENMKSKDAAALFEAMDPPFAAGFLGRMRPDAAAAIMAGLTPETAYTISVILAGRNANAPKS